MTEVRLASILRRNGYKCPHKGTKNHLEEPKLSEQKPQDPELHDRILAALRISEMSMAEVERQSAGGLSRAAISLWTNADPDKRTAPSPDKILLFSRATKTPVTWLMTGKFDPHAEHAINPHANEVMPVPGDERFEQEHFEKRMERLDRTARRNMRTDRAAAQDTMLQKRRRVLQSRRIADAEIRDYVWDKVPDALRSVERGQAGITFSDQQFKLDYVSRGLLMDWIPLPVDADDNLNRSRMDMTFPDLLWKMAILNKMDEKMQYDRIHAVLVVPYRVEETNEDGESGIRLNFDLKYGEFPSFDKTFTKFRNQAELMNVKLGMVPLNWLPKAVEVFEGREPKKGLLDTSRAPDHDAFMLKASIGML